MKSFLIFLTIGLAASDKLDRTYLPPPGAQFSGGSPGAIDVPLDLPHHPEPAIGTKNHPGSHDNFGINGESVNFGDKLPTVPFNHYTERVPSTTTSYAFSQTTTYPPAENYETTATPIDPVTGLPINLDQFNYPYGSTQKTQELQNYGPAASNFGTNVQPGFAPQGSTSRPITVSNPSYGQTINQYPGPAPGSTIKMPGSASQSSGQNENLVPTNQYSGQNAVSPGNTVQIPNGNQGLPQYPGQSISTQQGLISSPDSPQGIHSASQPGGSQFGVNYDGPEGTFSGQPINVQNIGEPQFNPASFQGQEPTNFGTPSQPYPNRDQNSIVSVAEDARDVHQPGSPSTVPGSPSTVPSTYYGGVSGTTLIPSVPSSTASSVAYSTVSPVYRPERPQAADDRNAVILNYENIRTPNGYSYSFDTSNGIHADESGIVDNGTKAQGAYSYTGDDGKVYSVIYTADENGFQPRGDHLPTPPPIPDAIKRVIEQAARDKEAGIIDDGSYDEHKYGDNKYQGPKNRNRLENQGQRQPITGINNSEYDDHVSQDQFINNPPLAGTRRKPSENQRPTNQVNDENNVSEISGGNGRVPVTNKNIPHGSIDRNAAPFTKVDGNNQQNKFGMNNPHSAEHFPIAAGNNLPYTSDKDVNELNQFGSKNREPISHRPTLSGVKDMKKNNPGTHVDYSEFEGSFNDEKGYDIGSPSASNVQHQETPPSANHVTGYDNKKQPAVKKIKENRRPGASINRYTENQKDRLQTYAPHSNDTPLISDYIENAKSEQGIQQDETGYLYQTPRTKFGQSEFPTRFNSPKVSTMQPDESRTQFRPSKIPSAYNQSDRSRQFTTRVPFTTNGVTAPTDTSFTDYDYNSESDLDVDDMGNNFSKTPTGQTGITSRPFKSTQTTSRPHYTPVEQRTHVTQEGTVAPGHRIEHSGTVTPEYIFGSTTPMPSYSSRFGSTETPRVIKPQQRRPSIITAPGSSTAVGRPVTSQRLSGSRTPDYKYQTTGPGSRYPTTKLMPGLTPTSTVPKYGLVPTSPAVSNLQNYYSSTNRPAQDYSSTSVVPPSGYKQHSGSVVSSSGTSQPSSIGSPQTGYYYEPPKSYFTTASPTTGPGFFFPSRNSGVSPTLTPGTYQTYEQDINGFPNTTPVYSTSGPGTFDISHPETSAPFSSNQGNYQFGPSSTNHPTTVVSSEPGVNPVFGSYGSTGTTSQTSPVGYEYGYSTPTYSTTASPYTVGTTPAPFQGYSTTNHPSFQATKDTFVSGPVVDGFGRPITSEQGGSYPNISSLDQASTGPSYQGTEFTNVPHISGRPFIGAPTEVNGLQSGNIPGASNFAPTFGSNGQFNQYPGSHSQSKITGEDFSGPKQPQTFDPDTGYHYK